MGINMRVNVHRKLKRPLCSSRRPKTPKQNGKNKKAIRTVAHPLVTLNAPFCLVKETATKGQEIPLPLVPPGIPCSNPMPSYRQTGASLKAWYYAGKAWRAWGRTG